MRFTADIKDAITGTFTINYVTGEHRTIILRFADDEFFNFDWAKGKLLLGILIGPDNSNDFRYIASLNPANGTVQFFQKFANDTTPERMKNIVRALEIAVNTWELSEENRPTDKAYAIKSNNCVKCGRKLTNGNTLRELRETLGMGKVCYSKASPLQPNKSMNI